MTRTRTCSAPRNTGASLLASLSPADISKDIEIPEAKLKEEYDQRQDELQLPERREVEQILAPSEEKAKEAEQALADGKRLARGRHYDRRSGSRTRSISAC